MSDEKSSKERLSMCMADVGKIYVTSPGRDNNTIGEAVASRADIKSTHTNAYAIEKIIGHGSFGVVFQATDLASKQPVAIKKVLQDPRYKNRELSIMMQINHYNVVKLKDSFIMENPETEEVYLHAVLEYIPDTVHRFAKVYARRREYIPFIYVRLFTYQLSRALAYIHSPALNVCHRDIKPQNLLINPTTGRLVLCDFGSAKSLVPGEPNVSYICSRYYRSPELIFGASNYTPAIDCWSLGCVFAELMIGTPLFPGESSVDQLVEIIKVMGTPTRSDIKAMNPNYTEFKFPAVRPHPWSKIFRSSTPPEAIDLLVRILRYPPNERLSPLEQCAHPFFDELRNPATKLPNGHPVPEMFNFSPEERQCVRLVP